MAQTERGRPRARARARVRTGRGRPNAALNGAKWCQTRASRAERVLNPTIRTPQRWEENEAQ
eukprot:4740011-Prorocentrum_lima.AAC.1